MSITQSPPPDASGTARGLVNLLAQTFAGAKTFLATIIASAGIQVGSLFNTNGTGASDVVVKVGASAADGTVSATAKLLSVRTGVGGTEVESFAIRKGGVMVGGAATLQLNDTAGAVLNYNNAAILTLAGASAGISVNGPLTLQSNGNTIIHRSSLGAGATDIGVKVGVSTADASVNATAKLESWCTGIGGTEVEYGYISKTGLGLQTALWINTSTGLVAARSWYKVANLHHVLSGSADGSTEYAWLDFGSGILNSAYGFSTTQNINASGSVTAGFGVSAAYLTIAPGAITDTSGTPGAATINAGKGRAALANAATSVTITNSLVDTNSVVLIEWEDDPGQRHRVTYAAGSFTVTLSAAAAASVKFRFFVVR